MRLDVALQIFNSMAPVFLLIFVGWLAVHWKIVGEGAKKVCSTMVSDFVFPALLMEKRPFAIGNAAGLQP
jgi:malonate transporter and related proteins